MNLVSQNSQKSEFKLSKYPLYGQEHDYKYPELVHALWEACDEFYFDEEYARKCVDGGAAPSMDYCKENGFFYDFSFTVGEANGYPIHLSFYTYNVNSLWCSVSVNNNSEREISSKDINLFTLTRKVRDLINRVYHLAKQYIPYSQYPDDFDDFWICTNMEVMDGLHDIRMWLYSKYFHLEEVTSFKDLVTDELILAESDNTAPEDKVYILIPLDNTGESGLFRYLPPEKHAA